MKVIYNRHCLILAVVAVMIVSGAAPPSLAGEVSQVFGRTNAPQIVVISSVQELELSQNTLLVPMLVINQADIPPVGSFKVSVATDLPSWGVTVSAEPFKGKRGQLPTDRLWVRTAATGGNYVRLDSQRAVFTGDVFDPVMSSSLDIKISPKWTDVAGTYSGQLLLSPSQPTQFSGPPGNSVMEMPTDQPLGVDVGLTIPEMFQLVVTQGEVSFDVNHGPGLYQAAQPLQFEVSTNVPNWSVICVATAFSQDGGTDDSPIPADRISWKLESSDPMPTTTAGNLGGTVVLLRGDQPVEALPVTVTFFLQILPEDLPGNYSLELNLDGRVE